MKERRDKEKKEEKKDIKSWKIHLTRMSKQYRAPSLWPDGQLLKGLVLPAIVLMPWAYSVSWSVPWCTTASDLHTYSLQI